MGRPIFPYELSDPDFSWLISNFKESNPEYDPIQTTCLPVVLISTEKRPRQLVEDVPPPPVVIPEKPAEKS